MATSGSKSVTVTSWDTLKFSWSESSQDITNNKTTISWKMELIAGSSGRISSTASKAWSVTVNGTKYSGTNTVGISNNATKTLASGTTTISHNSDGTKTFSYSFSQEFSITFSGSSIGTKSGSGSGTLDTIPRKSTLTASDGTLNTAQTLTINRNSSSFTHTITYKCGTATGTITTKTTGTSVSFTPPLSLASQNTTGTSVSVVFTIETFNGSTSLGKNTKTISCTIPSSVKPTVSITVSDPTGYLSTYGGYVQNRSKIKVVVTASGSHGSTIKSYSTTADGKTYTSSTVTTDVIKSTGSLTITTKVTDSRGRTATASTTITSLAYAKPKINAFSVKRCNSDGTANSTGDYLGITFSAIITSLNSKNTATYQLKRKKSTATSYTVATLTNYTGKYSVTNGTYVFSADKSASYDLILTATDAFESVTNSGSGSSGKSTFSILKNGLGWAFGKVAELENILDIAWITFPRGGFRYPVLADGTDLNTILTPNTYSGKNASSAGYLNVPFTTDTSFSLEVISQGADGQIMQRLTTCAKTNPATYVRFYYTQAWGSWLLVSVNYNWTNLTLDDAFKAYNGESNNTPKYKVSGNLVTVTGVVSPKEEYTSSNTKVPIASGIPANLRPSMAQTFICQGSSLNRWSCGVETNGTITIARYGVSGYVNVPNNAWLPFTVTYSI